MYTKVYDDTGIVIATVLEHDKDWTTWNEPNPNQITHTIYTNMHHTVQQSTRGTTVLLVSVILFIRRGVYLAPT